MRERGIWEKGDGPKKGGGGQMETERAGGEEKPSHPKVSAPESNLSPISGA